MNEIRVLPGEDPCTELIAIVPTRWIGYKLDTIAVNRDVTDCADLIACLLKQHEHELECPRCGKMNPHDARYCMSCRLPIAKSSLRFEGDNGIEGWYERGYKEGYFYE